MNGIFCSLAVVPPRLPTPPPLRSLPPSHGAHAEGGRQAPQAARPKQAQQEPDPQEGTGIHCFPSNLEPLPPASLALSIRHGPYNPPSPVRAFFFAAMGYTTDFYWSRAPCTPLPLRRCTWRPNLQKLVIGARRYPPPPQEKGKGEELKI